MSTPATPPPFDHVEYNRKANEADALARAGKPAPAAEPVAPAGAGSEQPGEKKEAAPVVVPKHIRRQLRQLLTEKAKLEGRLEVFTELGLKPGEKKVEPATAGSDPEPTRDQFGTDAEYSIALGRWDARQETRKVLATKDQEAAATVEFDALKARIKTADDKMELDKAQFDDWAAVTEAATAIEVNWDEQPSLYIRIAESDVKAAVLYHLAKNPDLFQSLLDAGIDTVKQDRMFSRLEGQVEKLYTTEKPKEKEKPKPTAAELDAKKHRPSEAVAPRGGSGSPAASTPMLLEDGKTLNPVWKAEQNEREGLRR